MEIPVENALAFFPPTVRAGNVTLGPLTLAGSVRIGQLGVEIGQRIPTEKLFQVAHILSVGSSVPLDRFLRRARVGLKELHNAVETVLNDAFRTYVKPAQGKGGTVHLTPHGLGMPLEYAEFLCAEYGWTWETAINTPLATVFALVAAHRQRNGNRHGGFDYIEKHYAESLRKKRGSVDRRKEEAV